MLVSLYTKHYHKQKGLNLHFGHSFSWQFWNNHSDLWFNHFMVLIHRFIIYSVCIQIRGILIIILHVFLLPKRPLPLSTTYRQECSTHQQYKNFHKATLIRIFNKFYIRNNITTSCIVQTFPGDRYLIMSALYHNISIRRLMY